MNFTRSLQAARPMMCAIGSAAILVIGTGTSVAAAEGSSLVEAAGRGDLDAIKKLLASGASVKDENKRGLTPWQAARIHGHKEAADLLLAQGATAQLPTNLERVVDATFKDVTRDGWPGAAVLVARNGKILFQHGYGLANLEHRVPVTPETKFRIGSITKQFTASAILKLREQGKLELDDKLSKFIPDFPRGDEVTIHHLLTHTSGIHSYTSKQGFLETVPLFIEAEDLIQSFKNDPYDFDPGKKWSYNNSGYFLLGYIVEKVSGRSYEDFLRANFFDPLGMTNTGVHHGREVLAHEAQGYAYEGGTIKKALNWDMSRAGGAGSLYSTVGDLYRWNEAVFNRKVLSEASLNTAFTPVKTAENQNETIEEGYGYGWGIGKLRGLRQIHHSGGLNGFLSDLARVPEEKFTVVVLANASPPPPPGLEPAALANEIAQLYLAEKLEWRPTILANKSVSTQALDACTGRYDYGGPILTVTREGARLFAQLSGQGKYEIFPKSETEFFWQVVDAQVTFVKDEKGKVIKAVHRGAGVGVINAPRLPDQAVARIETATLDAYVGKYDYGDGKAILTVTREGDQLFAQLTGQPKFEILPKSDTEFFWKAVDAQITFVKDEKGKVTKGIHQQAGRTFDVPKIK